jgi:coenzyme F420-reducing hydrogenase alpha subunit
MTDLSGRLQIHLRRAQDGLAVDIHSSRLVGASRVFVGKGVAETAATLPSLFSVCATAQAAACASACEGALGLTAPPGAARARELLVAAETAREHLWRLLLDWPGFLGERPAGPAMARTMSAFGRLRSALAVAFVIGGDPSRSGTAAPPPDRDAIKAALAEMADLAARQVLGRAPAAWLEETRTVEALRDWAAKADTAAARLLGLVDRQGWGALGRTRVPVLPPLSHADLESRLGGSAADAFMAAPLWDGAPAESSPFARQLGQALVYALAREQGNGLLPRLAAQLVELASILSELPARLTAMDSRLDSAVEAGQPMPDPVMASTLPRGVGLAQVQAARGLLVHRVHVEAERVASYRILAPTEWNFHPHGAAALGLATLPDADDATLRRLAGLFITALDPCVAYDLSIG